MSDWLLWTYIANAVLLINHEIDSAYWKEWELFNIPGGITTFLILHFPLLFLLLYGLLKVVEGETAGVVFALVFGIAGVSAFCIHVLFLAVGRKEFRTTISIFILVAVFVVSSVQVVLSIILVAGGK